MNTFERLRRWYSARQPKPIGDWFLVTCDDIGATLKAEPPGQDAWEQGFTWDSVERLCFKDEGLALSDAFYVFTSLRDEAFLVPVEAQGGELFWDKIQEIGLFPAEISGRAVQSTDGGFYCWPGGDNDPPE
jgi:hypothetical protein